jgi:MFS family permease
VRLGWLSADGKKLLAARALRSFGYGYLAVILGLFLDRLGADPEHIGFVLTAAVTGSALMTITWSLFADRYGRRRTAATMAVLMTAGGLVFASTSDLTILLIAAFTGTITPSNADVGAFLTVDQAMLPQTAPDARRTWLFSIYNGVAGLASAVGALVVAAAALFAELGLHGADAYRPLLLLYAAIGAANFVLFLTLSKGVELDRPTRPRRLLAVHRSTATVAKLSLLFGLDALAGSLVVQSLAAYWFFLRWGLAPSDLAVLFFCANLLSAVSLFGAGWLAARIGLLRTMVLTHIPSNALMILVPLAPTAPIAIAVFLLRVSLSQMDVPTRQSYTMAVVDPDERTATAGITSVARTVASIPSPVLTGAAFAGGMLALPFIVAGGLKIVYDCLMYVTFRNVRPPEEEVLGEASGGASVGS